MKLIPSLLVALLIFVYAPSLPAQSAQPTITPDVVSSVAWRFDEVEGDFDQFVLSCEALADEPVVVQEGTVDALLSPRQLLEIAERRLGPPPPGTSASRNGRRSRAASHGLASFERSSAGKPSSRRAKR